MSNEIISAEYLLTKGFKKAENFGWAKYRKNGFELVEIPLKKGGFIFGFQYLFCEQSSYKYPIKKNELSQLYKLLTGTKL